MRRSHGIHVRKWREVRPERTRQGVLRSVSGGKKTRCQRTEPREPKIQWIQLTGMLCNAMECNGMQCNTMQCNGMQRNLGMPSEMPPGNPGSPRMPKGESKGGILQDARGGVPGEPVPRGRGGATAPAPFAQKKLEPLRQSLIGEKLYFFLKKILKKNNLEIF